MLSIRLYAFWGMCAQLPLSIVTDKIIRNGRVGNVVLWISLILGQPLAVLMYLHDWYVINYPQHIDQAQQLPLGL